MRRISAVVQPVVVVLTGVLFVAVGTSKLGGLSAARWNQRFLNWGYPAGASYAVGIVEVVAGLALFVPATRRGAAIVLAVVIAGAFVTHVLHGEYVRVIVPIVLGVMCVFLSAHKPVAHGRGSEKG